ncbi:MAG: MmcQ/YjbR family DNA-binding protein [Sphingobacteriales bacterium]|nr:MmcQ/YjbR family DNA-binding protein [Sphingobacteriales bacterium]
MVTSEAVRQFALSFPETDEHPHFERTAFRVKKKIFASLSEKDMNVSLKLTLKDQSVFCSFDKTVIYPVPGGWGRMGFTFVNLRKVRKSMFKDALTVAYCTVAPPKLAEKFLPK